MAAVTFETLTSSPHDNSHMDLLADGQAIVLENKDSELMGKTGWVNQHFITVPT